jgi:hypothetical protein
MNASRRTPLALAATLLLAGGASAQSWSQTSAFVDKAEMNFDWQVFIGAEAMIETGMDAFDGRFDYIRGGGGLSTAGRLSDNVTMSFAAEYFYDDYQFEFPLALGSVESPWGGVHTLGLSAEFEFEFEDLTIFAGPVLQLSGEAEAEPGDALAGGGFAGAAFNLTENARIGGGVALMSEIEGDVDIFPIIYLEWDLANNVVLRSTPVSHAGTRWSSVEIAVQLVEAWELTAGAAYEQRRFRLDDEGPIVDGVGEFSFIPIWASMTYSPTENVSFSLYGTITAWGDLESYDMGGGQIGETDLSTSAIIGGHFSYRF